MDTIFGWCLQGNVTDNNDSLIFNVIVEENFLSEQIKKFWDIKMLGLTDIKQDLGVTEKKDMKRFESN